MCSLNRLIISFVQHGFIELASALEENTTLRELDLAGNSFESLEALEKFNESFKKNRNLKILNLAACRLDGKSIRIIAPSLCQHRSLERLHLDGNPIDRGLKYVRINLCKLFTLFYSY